MLSHLPTLRHVPEIEIVAVADVDRNSVKQAAERFHVKHCFTDYPRLLDDPSVEAVAVCVPAEFHVEIGLAVLDAGKHLFLEKPVALTLSDADRLVRRAARSKDKAMLGFNLRWHRLTQRARALIEQGALGPPEMISTRLTSYHETVPEWRKYRAVGGGVLFEQAVHHFDLWRFLLQREIEQVHAATQSGRWEDESATVTARMSGGVLASSVFAVHTGKTNEVEVFCQEGSLAFSYYRFDSFRYARGVERPDGLRVRLEEKIRALREMPGGVWRLQRGGDFHGSFQAEWRHFYQAIKHDLPVQCTFEDGRRALQVVLAAVRSAALGRPVNVAEISEAPPVQT